MTDDIVSLDGAVDLFVHADPCLLPRLGSDLQLAREAQAAGMRALVTASHHESTVGRAQLVGRELPGFTCLGGLVLNGYVGGLNVQAAEAALASGGRFIWMPTYDALAHARVMGGTGVTGSGGVVGAGRSPGLTVLDAAGRLEPTVREIVSLCRQYGGILGTGHTGPDEVAALAAEASDQGVPLIVNHPFFILTAPLSFYREMAERGAWIELSALVVLTNPPHATPAQFVELIQAVGPSRCVMGSDAGSRRHPRPTEALRVFAWRLVGAGLSSADLRAIMVTNPASLLGLD
jgi:hypothetical protein